MNKILYLLLFLLFQSLAIYAGELNRFLNGIGQKEKQEQLLLIR